MLELEQGSFQYRSMMIQTPDVSSADILIVEDEEPIARLMSLHLRAAGYSTHVCDNGDSALAALRDGSWRLVVLDRMLPGANGMKILRWLKASSSKAHTPVLMVTALGMASERVQGLNDGADDYLPKPFEPDELVARARALLRRSRCWKQVVRRLFGFSLIPMCRWCLRVINALNCVRWNTSC